MIPSVRYAFAVVVNVLLPWAAYRLALEHYGVEGALVASTVPLVVWIVVDLVRFAHFDALSAIVLAGIVLSIGVLALQPAQTVLHFREPLVSGFVGVLFLLSLWMRRPLVFYLARSTMSRERQGREREFDAMWQARPALMKSIRFMTAVWGVGLVGENVARLCALDWLSGDDAQRASALIRYAVYGGLTVWTVLYRRLIIRERDGR